MKICNQLLIMLLIISLAAVLLSGCRFQLSFGIGSFVTGESYANAEAYQTGTFTYEADQVEAIEIYWRSGEVGLVESDNAELSACESGGDLPEDTAMHYLLEDGILKIHFCESGAMINVKSNDKHLTLEIPKDIDLSVHTTSAPVKADVLEQNSILISAHSGKTELGTAEAESISLSSSSGTIRADSISAQSLKCDTSSGSVQLKNIEADKADIETTSGSVSLFLTKASDVKVSTSSGSTSLHLPENGAEIAYTAGSGRLHTMETFEQKGDLYVFGNGESRITVNSSSGNLKIQ